ncbi:MAG: hypothetical protein ACJ0SL_05700 [Candidatus Rariloculaceae bacterium]
MKGQLFIFATAALAGYAATAQAHHSWGAVYNGGREVADLTATIAGDHARRPHDAIAVTIMNDLGEPEEWTVQWRGERGGRGRGRDETASQYDFNVGDEVVIDGRVARDEDSKLIHMTTLVRPSDGWTVTAREGRGGRGRR